LGNILNYLYPDRCPACRRVMEAGEEQIHPGCREKFRRIKGPRCFKCGKTLFDVENNICPECRNKKHTYVYGLPLFEYNETARTAMLDFKKNGHRRNGDFFASEYVKNLGQTLKKLAPEVLIPVPVSDKKLRKRGFNQAEYLAERIGEALDIPVDATYLRRLGDTEQKELSGKERAKNALKSFELAGEPTEKRVCLVDDVYTTGSTIEGCTRVLKAAGVREVGFITVFYDSIT